MQLIDIVPPRALSRGHSGPRARNRVSPVCRVSGGIRYQKDVRMDLSFGIWPPVPPVDDLVPRAAAPGQRRRGFVGDGPAEGDGPDGRHRLGKAEDSPE